MAHRTLGSLALALLVVGAAIGFYRFVQPSPSADERMSGQTVCSLDEPRITSQDGDYVAAEVPRLNPDGSVTWTSSPDASNLKPIQTRVVTYDGPQRARIPLGSSVTATLSASPGTGTSRIGIDAGSLGSLSLAADHDEPVQVVSASPNQLDGNVNDDAPPVPITLTAIARHRVREWQTLQFFGQNGQGTGSGFDWYLVTDAVSEVRLSFPDANGQGTIQRFQSELYSPETGFLPTIRLAGQLANLPTNAADDEVDVQAQVRTGADVDRRTVKEFGVRQAEPTIVTVPFVPASHGLTTLTVTATAPILCQPVQPVTTTVQFLTASVAGREIADPEPGDQTVLSELTATVVDTDGAPVPGVHVSWFPYDSGSGVDHVANRSFQGQSQSPRSTTYLNRVFEWLGLGRAAAIGAMINPDAPEPTPAATGPLDPAHPAPQFGTSIPGLARYDPADPPEQPGGVTDVNGVAVAYLRWTPYVTQTTYPQVQARFTVPGDADTKFATLEGSRDDLPTPSIICVYERDAGQPYEPLFPADRGESFVPDCNFEAALSDPIRWLSTDHLHLHVLAKNPSATKSINFNLKVAVPSWATVENSFGGRVDGSVVTWPVSLGPDEEVSKPLNLSWERSP
jgi:hypothetical protein